MNKMNLSVCFSEVIVLLLLVRISEPQAFLG